MLQSLALLLLTEKNMQFGHSKRTKLATFPPNSNQPYDQYGQFEQLLIKATLLAC